MLKKPSRNRDAADIAVDNPAKAMEQFVAGLRRVLTAPKVEVRVKRRRRKRKRRT